MDHQLTKRGLSEKEARVTKAQMSMPRTARIKDEELEAILSEGDKGLLERPVSKGTEVVARVLSRVLIDALAILGAMWFAYWLRFETSIMLNTFPPDSIPLLNAIAVTIIFFTPILFISLKLGGMYDTHTRVRILDKIPRIAGAVNVYVISLLLASFLLSTDVLTRGFLVIFWVSCIIFIFAGRLLLHTLLSAAGIRDMVMRNTLIVGSGKVGKQLACKLLKHQGAGMRPIGFIDDDPLYTEFKEDELKNLRVLGGLKDLCRIIGDFNVEKVVIAFTVADSEQLLDMASKCNKMGIDCSIVPRLFEVITNDIKVNEVGGIPLIRLRDKKIEGWRKALKAVEDYVLGTTILLLTWPVLLVTAIAIKMDSPGPVFFSQERLGKNRRSFGFMKFRSMCKDAESMKDEMVGEDMSNWLCWKDKNDPRITRVGKWIRKYSVDELPQIFNVLKGEMSLVGPRPNLPKAVAQYKEWHTQRLNVKPGITGLWQVSGRSELPFDEMVKLDLYYIENWSLWMDFKIIVRTITAIFSSNGAY